MTKFNPKLQQGLSMLKKHNIIIQDNSSGDWIELYLVKGNKKVIGRFIANKYHWRSYDTPYYDGPSLFVINDTHLAKEWKSTGLGPLFYEYIADKVYPAWIINDRGSTSSEAQRMYRYYMRNPGIYDYVQLDAKVENGYVLTPDRADDIPMESFFDIEFPEEEWEAYEKKSKTEEFKKALLSSPFSKAYRRKEKSDIKQYVDEYIDPDFDYKDLPIK